jgi:hypothetical protein
MRTVQPSVPATANYEPSRFSATVVIFVFRALKDCDFSAFGEKRVMPPTFSFGKAIIYVSLFETAIAPMGFSMLTNLSIP